MVTIRIIKYDSFILTDQTKHTHTKDSSVAASDWDWIFHFIVFFMLHCKEVIYIKNQGAVRARLMSKRFPEIFIVWCLRANGNNDGPTDNAINNNNNNFFMFRLIDFPHDRRISDGCDCGWHVTFWFEKFNFAVARGEVIYVRLVSLTKARGRMFQSAWQEHQYRLVKCK